MLPCAAVCINTLPPAVSGTNTLKTALSGKAALSSLKTDHLLLEYQTPTGWLLYRSALLALQLCETKIIAFGLPLVAGLSIKDQLSVILPVSDVCVNDTP